MQEKRSTFTKEALYEVASHLIVQALHPEKYASTQSMTPRDIELSQQASLMTVCCVVKMLVGDIRELLENMGFPKEFVDKMDTILEAAKETDDEERLS